MRHRRPSSCSDRDVADFVATMLPRDRAGTDWATARTHACVSLGRRRKPADVGVFPSSDGPALCVVAADALFPEGVQIVGSRISTRGLRAHDRFDLVVADGSVIEGKRLQHIELAVAVATDQH